MRFSIVIRVINVILAVFNAHFGVLDPVTIFVIAHNDRKIYAPGFALIEIICQVIILHAQTPVFLLELLLLHLLPGILSSWPHNIRYRLRGLILDGSVIGWRSALTFNKHEDNPCGPYNCNGKKYGYHQLFIFHAPY